MNKPKNKWWSVKKFDVGRELANPDYVLWADKRIAALEKELSKQADNKQSVPCHECGKPVSEIAIAYCAECSENIGIG